MRENLINRSNWLLGVSLAVLVSAFCLQYYIDFGNLLKRWDNDDFSYCYLIPFLFLYLVFSRRKQLKTYPLNPSLGGVVVLGFSGILYLMGKLGSVETFTYMSIWVAVVGSIILIMGAKLAGALAFPLLILGFIVPVPPFLHNIFTFKLKLIASSLAVKMMQMVGISVYREGNIIDLGVTQLQVVEACSGLRYVYSLLLMGVLFSYIFHKRWWDRVLIVAASIPIAVLSNSLRIVITGVLMIHVSPKFAEGFLHSFSGLFIFMLSFIFLAMLSLILKSIKRTNPVGEKEKSQDNSSHLSPFNINTLKISYTWITSILFIVFWGLNITLASNQMMPERIPFGEFPTEIGNWKGEKTFLRKEILDALWADDYTQIQFHNKKTGEMLLLFVPYYEYQGTRHTAHSPVSCLIGGGYAPLSRKIIEKDFPEPLGKVKIRQMVLERNRDRLLANYWFQQRGRIIVSEYWNKIFLFWDSITKRRTDGALVRIEMPLREGQDIEKAQALLDSFTQKFMKILPQYVPG